MPISLCAVAVVGAEHAGDARPGEVGADHRVVEMGGVEREQRRVAVGEHAGRRVGQRWA